MIQNAATVDLTALVADLDRAAQKADVEIIDVMVDLADDIARYMREEVPVASGRLRDSIRVKVLNDRIEIGPEGVPYGVYVQYGTEPHEIRPKNARALRFNINGKTIFATVVHHPGTAPDPFATRAAERFFADLDKNAAERGAKLILGGSRVERT